MRSWADPSHGPSRSPRRFGLKVISANFTRGGSAANTLRNSSSRATNAGPVTGTRGRPGGRPGLARRPDGGDAGQVGPGVFERLGQDRDGLGGAGGGPPEGQDRHLLDGGGEVGGVVEVAAVLDRRRQGRGGRPRLPP